MRVWVDLANSPHPLLFGPIVRRLEDLGHDVVLTARDHAQTVELAHRRWAVVTVIGGESPPGPRAKAATLAHRVRALARWARAARPDIALSHNSYAQLAAARSLGVRAVTAMDFEHQPANHVGFRLAQRVLLPRALDGPQVRRQGARRRKVRFYPGLKEELYLGDFEPDSGVLAALGIEVGPDTVVVVARTPPSRALYHRFGNPLFEAALRAVGDVDEARCVVLPRHAEQARALAELGLPNLIVPPSAVDARSLMWSADVVLGAGGTMTREAALLGVPTFTLFAGEQPAVDRALITNGRLRRLRSVDDLLPLRPRERRPDEVAALRARGRDLVEQFVDTAIA